MTVRPTEYAEVERLYADQCTAPFPAGMTSFTYRDICPVWLDSYTSGCVHTWLANDGALDDWRWDVLSTCLARLEQLIPGLPSGPAGGYYAAWHRLALLVWNTHDRTGRG
ncbi:hypothetical protein AB0B31_38875 [Catellatospora citrea]|uniref:hypothetical protein n=1 Tax=Catellatospora citrea TaxID=53366 RepID=UPI0034117FCE